MPADDRTRQIAAVAALADPLRRALYEYVVAQDHEVSRDEAAAAVGIERGLAAFHLDRMVREGVLEASYSRLGAKPGRGGGRPSKLYRRGPTQVSISLPQREYELAARLLLRAVAGTSPAAQRTLEDTARGTGEALGRQARAAAGPRRRRDQVREGLVDQLRDHGFEPFVDEDGVTIRLRNCPFHALAREETDLVCGMNLKLVEGMVGGIGATGLQAVLDPRPDLCCVALRPTPRP
jgi:predicted ArsR family transcriptional regulator